jgi:hypothetical protein
VSLFHATRRRGRLARSLGCQLLSRRKVHAL